MFQTNHILVPSPIKIFGVQITYIISRTTLKKSFSTSFFTKILLNKPRLFRKRKDLGFINICKEREILA